MSHETWGKASHIGNFAPKSGFLDGMVAENEAGGRRWLWAKWVEKETAFLGGASVGFVVIYNRDLDRAVSCHEVCPPFTKYHRHTGMPYVEGILDNTRTIRTFELMRWLAWSMPCHTAPP